jgi:putative ABC transport system permease protein
VAERYPGDLVRVQSNRARVDQVSRGLLVFKLGLASIAAISLLVGGIGIMNILLASVSERTREIGIRKSAGARARDIRMQFLAESVAISGLGSLVGVVVGMGGALVATGLIRQITDAPVHAAFTWQSIVVACAAAILVGLVFGTYPARKASRLSPIDAIRHE